MVGAVSAPMPPIRAPMWDERRTGCARTGRREAVGAHRCGGRRHGGGRCPHRWILVAGQMFFIVVSRGLSQSLHRPSPAVMLGAPPVYGLRRGGGSPHGGVPDGLHGWGSGDRQALASSGGSRAGDADSNWASAARGAAFTERMKHGVRRVFVVAAVLMVVAVLAWIVVAVVAADAWVRGPALAASYGAPTAAVGLAAAALWARGRR